MRILLKNTQVMLGDRLMFTPVVRDLKKQHPDWELMVESFGPEIWVNNPHIHRGNEKPDKEFNIGPGKVTRGSKTNGLHITEAFRMSLQEQLGEQIKQGPFKPEIFLSDTEINDRTIKGHYWVINIDCGPFSAKRWRHERFQEVADKLGFITFVQVGLEKDNEYRLKGPNVIDMIGQTKIRELFRLVYHSAGCISLVSSLMHVAAAFDKPCVVLAGGREPFNFEKYANHRYIDMTGILPCCQKTACWHNSITACENIQSDNIAKCMDMIEADDVIREIIYYYQGGILKRPGNKPAHKRPLLRIVTNAKCLGGAERSVIEIARQFINKNWRVEISPATFMGADFKQALPEGAAINRHVSGPCDVLLLYCSDMVWNFDKSEFDVFKRLRAARKVMAVTYKLGKAGQEPWTIGWDKYLFLSSDLKDKFLVRQPGADTGVLAPAVDIEPFLKIRPDYNGGLRMVRHSSQGDAKYPASLEIICKESSAHFFFMPGPSWMRPERNITLYPYRNGPDKVAEFLGKGNCFLYLLPAGYTDQGPRVIVEAMAAGLPVIAENRDGAKDRITTETGWLIDKHEETADLLHSITYEELRRKGTAARTRAIETFSAKKWFNLIVG